jgi:hypothetical protein
MAESGRSTVERHSAATRDRDNSMGEFPFFQAWNLAGRGPEPKGPGITPL